MSLDTNPTSLPSASVAPPADVFLQFLVNLVNNGGQLKSIGVTLQMGGMLVSGSIVSGAEYFDRFAETFSDSLSDMGTQARQSVRTSLAELGDVFRLPQPAEPLPNYIHLVDALFFTADGTPIAGQPTLWRGRSSAVDGFILGRLQSE
ncbi:gas vesicle protein [Achromobacter xylosoxidans]|uniref:gas vesicle accessory protein GvpU n=1 Tax=Alcaligenes xylosoxydans xylosoxydans TaxID=85698 RepID=UPI00234AB2E1|nr:gas vesicle accessory protein GvpU [Achromobacter xylosoxidans]MDC6164594.1 gas vesicle protein [Achromobacter xylosoxidans]